MSEQERTNVRTSQQAGGRDVGAGSGRAEGQLPPEPGVEFPGTKKEDGEQEEVLWQIPALLQT